MKSINLIDNYPILLTRFQGHLFALSGLDTYDNKTELVNG